ncbi:glycoside hydrolase [Alternaria rosae]|uniref:glycoside hydrolase n=1 Tax=Alternaria rosae TaxID=1187941 RepID=UPI001E8D4C87|nr:glycoside hydrolase [Alternaria rosae]KAH6875036.1 glycoside hydrolase [Alternaria rosae]
MRFSVIVILPLLITAVQAHGRITQVTTPNGTIYEGWDPASSTNSTPPHPLAAWSASNLGNIYIPPSQFNTSNIACHYNALAGALHINTTAGDELKLHWNEWPVSHVGPVITYLAECEGSCANTKRQDLQWVKIDELGWLNSTGWDTLDLGGTWAADVLIANEYSWMFKIPERLIEGYYVLRHEIIALHVAENLDGAQAYPQCVNLRVARGTDEEGKKLAGGILGKDLYGMTDEGIHVNVHRKIDGYKIPGPKLWEHATPMRQPNQ